MTTEKTIYHPVTPAITAELRAIAGAPNVLYGDPERMLDYAHDETQGAQYSHMPEIVVRPDGVQEISQIMRLANRERIPVTPRGAGSGLSGGAVPIFGGIVLSLERMNRILEIDTGNLVAVVEPGVVTNDINEALKRHGLFYAGYPMSLETCFIGGNVGENAGGGRAIKYGVTGRYVLGLEVVLPTGEIVELGGKRLKDVTGYDLVHLMVGSEGTLGIFTRVVLRLLPLPAARIVLLIPFGDAASALGVVPRIIARAHTIPASIEFMDSAALRASYDLIGEKVPHPAAGALLLIELDGPSTSHVEAEAETVVDACLAGGALDAYVGNTPGTEKRMWQAREKVSEALTQQSPYQSGEDIVVPPAAISELLVELEEIASRHHVSVPCYGHAGDGNLHARIIKGPEMPVEEWEALKPRILSDLYRTVRRLGGTISGEHGIGLKRSTYLPLVMDPTLIELQRRIKLTFDPLNILNPGKIFPNP
jgi:glycolate oxidase